jgi:hypothetical protein
MTRKLRIAWFSDYASGGECGETLSSYCSSLLLPQLEERFEIELFSDSRASFAESTPGRHYLTAMTEHRKTPFDLFFYQIEDHRRLRFVRSQIGIMPGVLWAHDLYLSDLGAEALHTSPWEQTIRRYHDQRVPFSDRDHAARQFSPVAYREVSLNPVVLCSSPRGVRAVQQITTDRITTDSSGGFELGYLPVPVEVTQRRRSEQKDGSLQVVTAAAVGLEGRAHIFLPALKALKGRWHLVWMIDAAEQQRAARLLEEFGLTSEVSLVVGRSPQRWSKLIDSADIALHLHNYFFGHLAPYLQISLEAAVPCVTLRAIGGVDFPESAVWTVVPGRSEAQQISEAVALIGELGVAAAGSRGQEIVRRESEVSRVADVLAATFERSAPLVAPVMERWAQLFAEARGALFKEVQGLMDGADGESSPYKELFLPAARELGWQ